MANIPVDILCMSPSFVMTKMISHLKTPFNAISVEKCVSTGLRDLGHEEETSGALIHEATSIYSTFMGKYMGDIEYKIRRMLLQRGGSSAQ